MKLANPNHLMVLKNIIIIFYILSGNPVSAESSEFKKCNDVENFLKNENDYNKYCDSSFKRKIDAYNFILNYNEKKILKDVPFVNEYDFNTGVWDMLKLYKLKNELGRSLSSEKAEKIIVGYDILHAEMDFVYEDKRVIYAILKYFLYSPNLNNLRELHFRPKNSEDKNHIILLFGSSKQVSEKLACFGMIDLSGVKSSKIIGSQRFLDCLGRISL